MATPIPANNAAFTAEELAVATGGELFDVDASTAIVGIASDSRAVVGGNAFVALCGESFDGHGFVAAARAAGARMVVVERGKGVTGPRLEVDDTLDALGAIASAHLEKLRDASDMRVLAVGGAVGKTTTKTLLAAGALAYFKTAAATEGNLNNRIGVPHTLLSLSGQEAAVIVETGTSLRGEIAKLGAIVQPDVALVLNVDVEHTEGLGTLEDVADEEACLFASARTSCVTLESDALLKARLPNKKTWTFGTTPDATVQLVSRKLEGEWQEIFVAWNQERRASRVSTRLLGEAAALNMVAAITALHALATCRGEPVEPTRFRAALDAMAAVVPVPGRFVPHRRSAGGIVIDDSYNANPKSVLASIASAKEIAQSLGAPLVLCLGEMRELGSYAAESHDEVLRAALAAEPRLCALVGMEFTLASMRADADVHVFADSHALLEVCEQISDRDVVLVKGSRGVRMERLVDALVQRPSNA